MKKSLFITEKPSVAMEFAKILGVNGQRKDGFIEAEKAVITWCVGHLVTMSYPEAYDANLKRWSLNALPFLPEQYKYEIIPEVKKQFDIVREQLQRPDVDKIYVCTDSGREGEYIYRLIDQMVGVHGKGKKRVWIDSQTEDEVKRGIKEAKPLSDYNSLAESAYLRAKEDYLAGINFSRLLTLLYGQVVGNFAKADKVVIAVGRVMSCVLGMIVDREREIRNFVKTQFYKITGSFDADGQFYYEGEWKAVEGSKYYHSNALYNESGFISREEAEKFISELNKSNKAIIEDVSKKQIKENAPLLFNLAELQNECTKRFKLSPDQTLNIVQNLYEKKLLTYPRTDARVLSTAVAKEIKKNLSGIAAYGSNKDLKVIAQKIIDGKWYSGLPKSKYVNDDKITDHYAIIPTGQGFENINGLKDIEKKVYELAARRFLAIFYPPAVFNKISVVTGVEKEKFYTSEKVCLAAGYLEVLKPIKEENEEQESKNKNIELLEKLKKGQIVDISQFSIKERETSPPNRYTSGSIILAMENAGKLIEEEELREQIKGSGIGTSATRAEIVKKLERIGYIICNKKTQILTPAIKGELIYDVIKDSIPDLLNPRLTASWEKGLEMVARNEVKPDYYMEKLEKYIKEKTETVLNKKKYSDTKKLFAEVPKVELAVETQDKEKKKTKEDKSTLGICPVCKSGDIIKTGKGHICSQAEKGCKFLIGKILGKEISSSQVKKLIKDGKSDIIKGFKSSQGKKFDARLRLNNGKLEFSFDKNSS